MGNTANINTLNLPCATRAGGAGRVWILFAVFCLAFGLRVFPPAAAYAQAADSDKAASPQSGAARGTPRAAAPTVAAIYRRLPLSFTANQGQADGSVNFLAKGQGYGLYLTANEAVLALSKPAPQVSRASMQEIAHLRARWPFLSSLQRRRLANLSAGLRGTDTLRMELKRGNSQAQVSGSDELPGTTNYFLGNDPARWRTRAPSFAKVHYTGVYPGIDLIYYGNQRRLEYDFVVAPHADPTQVELHFSGARQLKLDRDGNLLIFGDNGEVAFQKPVVYQDEQGHRVPIKGRYALLANHTVGFKVGSYDRNKALVIDPTLSYSTYIGGSTDDAGTAIAIDAAGNIYIIGFTIDTDFPVTPGSFLTTNALDNEVAFVAKLNAAGSALVYSTYLGGADSGVHVAGNDAFGIAVDTAGSAYICGETYSNDFPVTTGAFQAQNKAYANNAQNAFISKLSADGTALVYSTYLGGSGLDIAGEFYDGDSPLRMSVDAAGSAYVVGTAYSTDFPTTSGAYQLSNKAAANLASNAFVAKLSPNGSSLAFSTYLGGSGISPSTLTGNGGEGGGEQGYGIAVDAAGEAYVTGYTFSADFPATGNGYQQVNHGTANVAANAFVSKLNATGTGLADSTYLGGTGRTLGSGSSNLSVSDNGDDGIGVVLDASGDAYVIGVTSSADFPTTAGAYQTTNKGAANIAGNVFVSKLDPTLSTLMYSTYVGGSGIPSTTTGDVGTGDFGTGIAVDAAGNAYITGATESPDFPVTSGAFQTGPRSTHVNDSGFFTEVNPNGTGLQYSTYLGGSGASSYGGTIKSFFEGDFFYDIALDASGNAYLTGYAYSYDFPVTKNAIQTVNDAGGQPGGNSFIAKFGATPGVTFLPTTTTLSSITTGTNITFTAAVQPATGAGVPTGTVSFYVNSVKATTVTLNGTGTAAFTTNQLADTLNNVIAAYSGDASYGASGSSLGQNGAGLQQTTLTLTAIPASSVIGQTVTLTAALAPFNGNGFTSDGETVTFFNGGTAIGTGTLTGGVATFSTSTLPAGVDILSASYPGDTNLAASVSQGLSYTVSSSTGTATATTLAVTAGGSPVTTVTSGTAVTLAASVTSNGAPVSPGLVSFCDATARCENSAILGTAQLTTAGTAVLRFVPAIGSHAYTAVFAGTTSDASSTSAAQSLTVTGLYPTTTTISAAGSPGDYTLTSTVVGTGVSALTPSGSVSLIDQTNSSAVLGSVALGAGTPAQTLVAATGSPLTPGTAPYAVATGDFNGDGLTDFAVENYGSNTVSVFLGNGDGTFKPQVSYAVGTEPEGIAAADVNGDGKLDLIVTNTGDSTVGVLLGNGDGTFQTQATYTTDTGPAGIIVADFNNDGKLDIATSNFYAADVSILLGNGDGTFQTEVTYAVGNEPRTLTSGDFNGNGNIDLAVANQQDNTVSILSGNGDGTFQNQVLYPTGNSPQGLAVADFNSDGIPDLAVGNSGDGTVGIMLGTSSGAFGTMTVYSAGNGALGPVVADFNGDGKADVAVENFIEGSESLLLGNGDGTFQTQTVFSVGTNPYAAALGNFNSDGYPDLVISNFGSNYESILLDQITSTATAVLTPVAVTGAAGNHNVVATYPGDTNFTTSISTPVVLVAQTASAPTITSLSPNSAYVGSSATVVTITGTQFLTGAAVTVNGTSQAATFVSATQLTTTLTAAELSTVGTLTLAVVNLDGGTSNSATFTVSPPLISSPTIASLSPNSAYVGSGNTAVTITGTQFLTGAAVTVNGTSQTARFVSATQLTTTLTTAQQSTVGTLTLAVVNPDGGTSNAATFTVLQQPLQLTPASLAFGNQTVGTPSASQVVTVTNSTAAAIAIATITLDLGLNPGDFAQTNNCPATIGAGANCQITITFTPGGVGPKSAGLLVADNTSQPQESVSLTGTGTGGILQVNPGNLKTIAGNGTAGYSGDGGPAAAAELNDPDGVNFDAQGNLYIADLVNNVIRKVNSSGNIATVAGNGTAGFSGDGGPATAAELNGPFGVVPDSVGNLYIEDTLNARIRKVDATGTITTIAGNGTFGLTGDGGPATAAEVAEVQGARFDAAGNLYVAQCGPAAIRKIDTAGIITTVAGNGIDGFSGDGGPATSAQLNCASGVAIDAAGELLIADYLNNRIRKVAADGIITTIAGNGTPGFAGDGGAAIAAEINFPNDVDVDAAGDVYIADSGNNRIRKIDPTGVITTVVGGLNNAGSAGVNAPSALALDGAGNLYFSDAGNNAVREVFPAGALAFPTTAVGVAATPLTVTLSNIGNLPVTIASQASFGQSGDTTDFSLPGGSCLAGATLVANGGSCTLQIGFTPTTTGTRTLAVSITDDAVYSPQSFSISGVGTTAPAVVLTTIAPAGAIAGAADTMITATGANFTPTSVVNFNTTPLVTTFVSATQLTAVVPAVLITAAGSANITITDPFSETTSQPQAFTILPGTPQVVTFTAPPANPGEQPTLNFSLTQGYPVAISGTMTLIFTPDSGNPDNPQIQLASTSTDVTVAPGGRTLTFPLAANSTAVPVVLVQVGNVSGTITITLQLTASGVNVTPTTVVPVTIVVPRVAPTVTALSLSASGNTLTVLVTGFSTTREIQSATFVFTPSSGASLAEKTLTVPAATLFTTWYAAGDSAQYGSAFTYSQQFTLSGPASTVASVSVTLTNAVGTSSGVTSQ